MLHNPELTLNRAKEIAQIISIHNNDIPIFYNTHLNERHFGEIINNERVNLAYEIDFDKRIAATIRAILTQAYENLIIVSHCEVCKSLQKTLLNHSTFKYIHKGEAMLFMYNHPQWNISSIDNL